LRGPLLARPSSSRAHDDDRLRLPPVSPARSHEAEKKESAVHPLSQLCPRYVTPFSRSYLDHLHSGVHTAENGFAASGGMSKSAKVVLAIPRTAHQPSA